MFVYVHVCMLGFPMQLSSAWYSFPRSPIFSCMESHISKHKIHIMLSSLRNALELHYIQ